MKHKLTLLFLVLITFITIVACNTNIKDVKKIELKKDHNYQVFIDKKNHIKLRLMPENKEKGIGAGFYVIGPESSTIESIVIPHYTSLYPSSFPIVAVYERAFFNNTNIKSVKFESNNSHMKIIGNYAFSGCKNINTEIKVPISVTTIGNGAFYNCIKYNSSFAIPENIETIGKAAFYKTPIKGTLILNNVKFIGENAFNGCKCETIRIKPVKGITIIEKDAIPFNLPENTNKIIINTKEESIPNEKKYCREWGWSIGWTSDYSKVEKSTE